MLYRVRYRVLEEYPVPVSHYCVDSRTRCPRTGATMRASPRGARARARGKSRATASRACMIGVSIIARTHASQGASVLRIAWRSSLRDGHPEGRSGARRAGRHGCC